MGFSSVYRTLQELFPQVDARLLKAAAFEHSDDPEGSVDFILTEVLPYTNTTKPFGASSSITQNWQDLSSVENERHCVPEFDISTCVSSSIHSSTSHAGEAANGSGEMNEPHHVVPECLNDVVHGSLDSKYYDAKDIGEHMIRIIGQAAIKSREMNEHCHINQICLNEIVNGSLHSTISDAKDIGDQLCGSIGKAANGNGERTKTCHVDTTCLNETLDRSLDTTDCDVRGIGNWLSGNTRTKELTSSRFCEEAGAIVGEDVSYHNISVSHTSEEVYDTDGSLVSDDKGLEDTAALHRDFDLSDLGFSSSLSSIVLDNAVPDVCSNGKQPIRFDSPNVSLSEGLKGSVHVDDQKKRANFGSDLLCGSNYVELSSLSLKDHILESLDCSIQSEVQSSVTASNHKIPQYNGIADGAFREDIQVPGSAIVEESSASNHKIPKYNGIDDGAFREEIQVPGSAIIEELSSLHPVPTRSGQLCSSGLLEDIIEAAKTHKKTLLSSMEAVLKLMKEVELEEKITQQAKAEAGKGGLEIVAKVEELKRMLNHARDANDMHSGEVYGERAILATEMRELQSRLLVLSDEKDNSLSKLNTMRQALETWLTAAESERIAAEQEKHEKERIAQRALAEQELIMEKVVQESKILQHDAHENAKLREFLVDLGHVVDTLQGEITVICQYVKLLKDKYDSSVPLSECISPKQTSCILASSVSSLRSTGSDQVLEQQAIWHSSPNESFLIPSVKLVSELDQEEPVEEGWELF